MILVFIAPMFSQSFMNAVQLVGVLNEEVVSSTGNESNAQLKLTLVTGCAFLSFEPFLSGLE